MLTKQKRTKISKFLALLLRHRPQTAGLVLDEAGWVAVTELLEGCARAGPRITLEELQEVVELDGKKRYEFSADGSSIRASQGHSIDIDLGYEPAEPPEILYHGTAERNLESIREQGLVKGKRHHVHLSADTETGRNVGQRYGKPVVLTVLAERMHADGHAFFVSTNGVWLTDHVPSGYLEFP